MDIHRGQRVVMISCLLGPGWELIGDGRTSALRGRVSNTANTVMTRLGSLGEVGPQHPQRLYLLPGVSSAWPQYIAPSGKASLFPPLYLHS
jgi:hypothetical protein